MKIILHNHRINKGLVTTSFTQLNRYSHTINQECAKGWMKKHQTDIVCPNITHFDKSSWRTHKLPKQTEQKGRKHSLTSI